MSTYQQAWLLAQANNDKVVLILSGCGLLLAAAWYALAIVPERWRGIAEIFYLVSIGALYTAVLILAGS